MKPEKNKNEIGLPDCVTEYIKSVIRQVRYRLKVRREVERELTDHFVDALADCTSEQEQNELGEKLVAEFGEAKVLGKLIRRGKKRCRPLWQKAMIRSFQVMCIFFIIVGLRAIHLSVGKPNVKVDYVAWLNEKVRAGHDESLNAKPFYDKAIEMGSKNLPAFIRECKNTSNDYWPGEMSEPEREEVARYIQENQEAFAALREGAARPYCWTVYGDDTESVKDRPFITNVLPRVDEYRDIARGLALQINWKAYRGDVEGALTDCVVLQKYGGHMQGKGFLIEQLVGICIERVGHRMTLMVLNRVDVPTETLRDMALELTKVYDTQKDVLCYEAEKVFWYDYIQRSFTDNGKGGGRALKEALPLMVGDWKDGIKGYFFGYPNRREVIELVEEHFDFTRDYLKKSPWELRHDRRTAEARERIKAKSFLLRILVTPISNTGRNVWNLKADRIGLLTVLALLQYENDKERYPVKLEELVKGGYLRELPDDPYSEGILKYERRGEEFILYSVGADFVDDGGKQYPMGDWGEGEKGGDRVFWPLEEKKPQMNADEK